MKHYNYSDFNLKNLQKIKTSKSISIGVCLPVLNEAQTLNKVVNVVRSCGSLVDEVVIIDSGSNDGSTKIGKDLGVRVIRDSYSSKKIGMKLKRGKGWNLWSSLYFLNTDIIIWIDSDIRNINQRFILGLIGPMLTDKAIKFVKGFYKRPKGDSRVTEILVRPFLNFFFPKTINVIQPLSGEYGGYRKFLEKIHFYSGYSVDVSILLNAFHLLKQNEIAQVNLGKRVHSLHTVTFLGKMAASILKTLLYFVVEFDILIINKKPKSVLRQFDIVQNIPSCNDFVASDYLLPPMITVQSYQKKFNF